MKRFFSLLTSLLLAGTLAACAETGGQSAASDPASPASEPQTFSSPEISSESQAEPASEEETRVLVAYFSATGNTGRIAGILQSALDADLFAIQPQEPYTEDDLNYSNDDCRANQEQNDRTPGPPSPARRTTRTAMTWCFWGIPSGGAAPPRWYIPSWKAAILGMRSSCRSAPPVPAGSAPVRRICTLLPARHSGRRGAGLPAVPPRMRF